MNNKIIAKALLKWILIAIASSVIVWIFNYFTFNIILSEADFIHTTLAGFVGVILVEGYINGW